MNDDQLFKNFYDELYEDILKEYYEEMDLDMKKNYVYLLMSIFVIVIIPTIALAIIAHINDFVPSFIILILFYDSLISIYLFKTNRHHNQESWKMIKEQILEDLIVFISKDIDAKILPNSRINKSFLEKMGLFDLEKAKYNGANYIKVNLHNRDIFLSDIDIYTYVEKIKEEDFYVGNRHFLRTYKIKKEKKIFYGCYIGSEIKKKNDIIIKIVPKNFKNHKYYHIDEPKINLESSTFSDRYDVYSYDEIKTRIVLSLPMMEKISNLDEILNNKKFIIIKNDGKYALFVKDFSIEKIIDDNFQLNKKKKRNYEDIYKIYKDLAKLFQISDIINNS